MKKTLKKYLIFDPINEVFWDRNFHYGYAMNNKAIFEARFTEVLTEATLMVKRDADEVLQRFSENEFVLGGTVKADAKALVVKPVLVTWEMEHEKFNPFSRDPRITQVSEADLEYLKGTPAPLKITIPVKIEKVCEDCGFYHPGGTCMDS